MKGALEQALTSTLYRILELEPIITLNEARERMLQVIHAAGMAKLDETSLKETVESAATRYKRFGVLNPKWMAAHDFYPHFFLVNSPPGSLQQLTEETSRKNDGMSQYILYGEWDSLLILYGTDREAQEQLKALSSSYYQPTYFAAHEVPLLYRYRAIDYRLPTSKVSDETVNAIALDYDNESDRETRKTLEESHILLGPTWKSEDNLSERIQAWVGIKIAGHQVLQGSEVLNRLEQDESLQTTLVHFFVTTQHPFQYFAKLICNSMEELDRATNAIGYASIGPVRMEGTTLVVTRGMDTIPVIRRSSIRRLAAPILDDLEMAARDSVGKLGEDAVDEFNRLNVDGKLQVLSAMRDLAAVTEKPNWDDDKAARIEKATEAFIRAIISSSSGAGITGAIMEAAASVEGQAKRLVRVIAEEQYGSDAARIQKELRLASKDLKLLSLGKAVAALEVVKKHPDFADADKLLDTHWMERAHTFAEQRNQWAHDAVDDRWPMYKIERAKADLIEAIELTRWLSYLTSKLPAPVSGSAVKKKVLAIPTKREGREAGVFVSYSNKDKPFAERLATALRAIGYNVWYADWAIEPGDSIIEKIETGLAEKDTLLILLSPASISSKWVERELNSAIMAQLKGHDVKVIPLLVEACTVPATIEAVKYIDVPTQGFQGAFIELMRALERRWNPKTPE